MSKTILTEEKRKFRDKYFTENPSVKGEFLMVGEGFVIYFDEVWQFIEELVARKLSEQKVFFIKRGEIFTVTNTELQHITLERRALMENKDYWTIFDGHNCLDKQGEWQYEPSPSNRKKEFLEQTRYSYEEAMELIEKYLT